MNEIWGRLGLVVAALGVAAVVAIILRFRSKGPVRAVEASGYLPGLYFFSSTTCATCLAARSEIEAAVGASGYTELTWEGDPEVLSTLGVGAVPAVMIVDDHGRGRLYPGPPRRALARV